MQSTMCKNYRLNSLLYVNVRIKTCIAYAAQNDNTYFSSSPSLSVMLLVFVNNTDANRLSTHNMPSSEAVAHADAAAPWPGNWPTSWSITDATDATFAAAANADDALYSVGEVHENKEVIHLLHQCNCAKLCKYTVIQ